MNLEMRDTGLRQSQTSFSPIESAQEDGEFEGYAAIFGTEDLAQDIIAPGAFRASLDAKGARGIRLLYQHQPNEPIGRWLEVYEDGRGLYVRGQILLDVLRGREVFSLMRAGAVDGLSIGFHALKGHRDQKTGVRTLFEIDLWEVSIVTFPMQPGARIHSTKFYYSLADTIWRAARQVDPHLRSGRQPHFNHRLKEIVE